MNGKKTFKAFDETGNPVVITVTPVKFFKGTDQVSVMSKMLHQMISTKYGEVKPKRRAKSPK